MDLFKRFQEFIEKESLFLASDSLLLAISGGVDSVVLCELCRLAGFKFTIAHCNFQLRGEESERDENFVKALAEKHGIPIFLSRFDTNNYAEEKKISVQVAARELRYEWFREVAGTAIILTAHHADDNIETVMMNFFKGTGIGGLHGILPKQSGLARPLLFAYKEDIEAFARENKLSYVTDSSNSSDKYTRNYFRNQLIPALEKVYPAVKENLQNSILRFRDVEILYKQSVDRHRKNLLYHKGAELHIPILKLKKSIPVSTLLYEIIKDFGFSSAQVGEVMNILDSESGRYVSSASHRIIKNRNWLIISPVQAEQSGFIIIEKEDRAVRFLFGELILETRPANSFLLSASLSVAQFDAGKIQFPLLLRKWKQGDYFYPLGMQKKKKLSRFFIDQKMSLTEKENSWVIEMNKKIIWVAGRRIDDRFKTTSATQQVLKIQLL